MFVGEINIFWKNSTCCSRKINLQIQAWNQSERLKQVKVRKHNWKGLFEPDVGRQYENMLQRVHGAENYKK